jgi:hypothetical protein
MTLSEDFVGCGNDAQVLGDPGHAKQALDLLGALGYRELLPAIPAALERREHAAQPGGVDELELLEIEHDHLLAVRGLHGLLEQLDGGHIQFTVKRQDHAISFAPHPDLKLVPCPHGVILPEKRSPKAKREQRDVIAQPAIGSSQCLPLDLSEHAAKRGLRPLRGRPEQRLLTELQARSVGLR